MGIFVYGDREEMLGISSLAGNAPTRVEQLFEPGAQELRFQGTGFETIGLLVAIRAVEETPVHVRMQRR